MKDQKTYLFAGSYTEPGFPAGEAGQGITIFELDASGALRQVEIFAGVVNPTWLTVHPDKKTLYAVNETWGTETEPWGRVSALRIEKGADGVPSLRLLNSVPSMGNAPCHLELDRKGRFLAVANYHGCNVALLPLNSDGSLNEASFTRRYLGWGPVERQFAPHPHMNIVSADNALVYTIDLGSDRIAVAALDAEKGILTKTDLDTPLKAGSGPRHGVFSSSGRNLYVVNEIAGTVEVFEVASGALSSVQSISTVKEDDVGIPDSGTIRISSNGNYLYASNRGKVNSIVCYAVDTATGRLSLVAHQPSGGTVPRDFVLDPSGRFLLAGNLGSGTINTFVVEQSGRLSPTAFAAKAPLVSGLAFY